MLKIWLADFSQFESKDISLWNLVAAGNDELRCPCGYAGSNQRCYRPARTNVTSEEARITCMFDTSMGRVNRLHSDEDVEAFNQLADYISSS